MRNVFVLGTGRCGSVTFAKSCQHITNWTVGHETRAALYGDDRFKYPPDHIEVDPRLAWFYAELHRLYPDALYVHLVRDPEATARSIARRWGGAASFARSFGESMLLRGREASPDRLGIARFQVRVVQANVDWFVRWCQNGLTVRLGEHEDWLPRFWKIIRAKGNLDEAMSEWSVRYNASKVRA